MTNSNVELQNGNELKIYDSLYCKHHGKVKFTRLPVAPIHKLNYDTEYFFIIHT